MELKTSTEPEAQAEMTDLPAAEAAHDEPVQPNPGVHVANEEDLGDRLDRLEQRQDHAQSFRSPPNLVSLAALVISGFAAVFTAYHALDRATESEHQTLTEIIEKLAEIDIEEARVLQSTLGEPARAMAMSLANRRMGLLQSADRLIDSLGSAVTPSEYAVLAVGFFRAGDTARAEAYTLRFLREVDDPVQLALGHRSLANIYWAQGPDRMAEARVSFEAALALLVDSRETRFLTTRVDILSFWAGAERAYGDLEVALEKALLARQTIRQMPCMEGRTLMLSQVEPMIVELRTRLPEAPGDAQDEVGSEQGAIDCPADAMAMAGGQASSRD